MAVKDPLKYMLLHMCVFGLTRVKSTYLTPQVAGSFDLES